MTLVAGLYEQLITQELKHLLESLGPARVAVDSPDAADAYAAVSEHLRRIIQRVLRAIPEEDRLTRQAQLCNALISWLQSEAIDGSVRSADALTIPLQVLREIQTLSRGAAFGASTPQPLVPLSSADLLVNARGEPSVGAAIEREIYCRSD